MNLKTPELKSTQAWILAGGQGERLHPLTVSRPKPTVSFGGTFRIIDFTLSNCLYSSLGRVSLLTQYRYEELHRYIREGWSERWNNSDRVDRSPLVFLPPARGKRYRSTADAIFQNSELLQSGNTEFVLVLSSGHIYHMDYRGFLRQHAETGADVTIATVEHPLRAASHFGVVEVDRNFKVIGFEEKPVNPQPLLSNPSMSLVSMGIYVFKKKALLESLRHFCESGQDYDLDRDIIPSLYQSGRTYAYDFRNEVRDCPRYWQDIETVDGYYETSMDLIRPDPPFDPYANDCWPLQLKVRPSLRMHSEAERFRGLYRHCDVRRSVISPDVHLEECVTISDSVLMPGVRVGKDARLRRTIVEEDVHIPSGFQTGFDPDQDRQHCTVTAGGVVVVSRTPACSRPRVLLFTPRQPNVRVMKKMKYEDGERAAA